MTSSAGPAAPPSCRSGGCSNGAARSSTTAPSPRSADTSLGVLIPAAWTRAVGIPENAYRWFSAAAGTLAAVLVIIGVVILASRRLIIPRVRATTAPVDYVALILLLIIILTGIAPTIFVNLFGHGYDYRTTVAPWFRGLFSGHRT